MNERLTAIFERFKKKEGFPPRKLLVMGDTDFKKWCEGQGVVEVENWVGKGYLDELKRERYDEASLYQMGDKWFYRTKGAESFAYLGDNLRPVTWISRQFDSRGECEAKMEVIAYKPKEESQKA